MTRTKNGRVAAAGESTGMIGQPVSVALVPEP